MGPRERREREREEIRTLILDAARELFASEGVESVTMRRIAERIEYSPTAIYFHFRDKEALLAELCDTDFLAMAQELNSISSIEDPIERLRGTGHAYAAFGIQNPSHYRVMFMTPKPPAAEEAKLRKGHPEEDAYAFLKSTVEQAMSEGRIRRDIRDADLLSQVIWSGIHGVISLEIAKCNDDWVDWRPILERTKLMIDILMAGITAGAASSPKTTTKTKKNARAQRATRSKD